MSYYCFKNTTLFKGLNPFNIYLNSKLYSVIIYEEIDSVNNVHYEVSMMIKDKKEVKSEKIEICFICNKEFDMNEDDISRYIHGKYPLCPYCSEFYGFY
jgi:uncharacterized protein with PIN domain